MTTTKTPDRDGADAPVARIRGALGDKVLHKSPELFNQGLPTVLAEALQNSRRAGAARVEAELLGGEGRATLVLRDDGRGVGDMAKLVSFGASGWDERTDLAENAAGMGVFSLASRGVTVRSRGRRVTLTREVFCGEAEAAVLPDPGAVVGTELLFPVAEPCPEAALARACRFYPLPVTLNGRRMEQARFLDGAAHVVEWQGLRLGVFRDGGPKVLDLFDRHRGWDGRLYLNFHGHVVECRGPVRLAEVGGRASRWGYGRIWSVFVDVVEASDLRLVLPARNEPFDNGFFRAMRARAERAILVCVALQPSHSLAFKDAERAARLGVALPPVEIALQPWTMPSDELRHRRDPAPVVVGAPGGAPAPLLVDGFGALDTASQANLHRLLLGWRGGPAVLEAEPDFAGYPAYDALPVVAGLAATATGEDGATATLTSAVDGADGPAPTTDEQRVVEAVSVRLLVRDRRGPGREPPMVVHEASAPFFFTSEGWDSEFPGMVAAKGTDPGALADALVECFFSHSEDADADSYDRQLEAYAAEARDLARTLLLSGAEAVAARIVEELRGIRWTLRTLGAGTVEIRIAGGADAGTVRVVAPDGRETTAAL